LPTKSSIKQSGLAFLKTGVFETFSEFT
jgi:hypothetical protein